MKELFSALVKAQSQMGKAHKDATNPHFRSKYANLESCFDAVREVFAAHGLGFVQVQHEAQGGVFVETVIVHESGEQFSGGKLFVPANKQDAQGYGSALTYARRYSLSATVGLATEDDDGNAATASVTQSKTQQVQQKITKEQAQTISELADEAGADKMAFCGWLKVKSIADLPASQYDRAVAALEKKLQEKK